MNPSCHSSHLSSFLLLLICSISFKWMELFIRSRFLLLLKILPAPQWPSDGEQKKVTDLVHLRADVSSWNTLQTARQTVDFLRLPFHIKRHFGKQDAESEENIKTTVQVIACHSVRDGANKVVVIIMSDCTASVFRKDGWCNESLADCSTMTSNRCMQRRVIFRLRCFVIQQLTLLTIWNLMRRAWSCLLQDHGS